MTPNGRLPRPPVKGTTLTALRFLNRRASEWLRQAPDHLSKPPSPDDGRGHTPCPCWEVAPRAVDARYRDKGGEISRKYGDALIGRLRMSYGSGFAKGCGDDDKLSDVLVKLDERSLSKLVRDYKNGMLPIRLRTR